MRYQKAKLIFDTSLSNADLYWATHFFAPDPFYFVQKGGRKILLLSDLEYGRAKNEAQVSQVRTQSFYKSRLKKNRRPENYPFDILVLFLRDLKIRSLVVPANFPFKTALDLKRCGFSLTSSTGPFFPKRLIKTPAEKKEIQKSLRAVSQSFGKAMDILRKSRIRGHSLYFQGQRLTSEYLRGHIEQDLLSQGYTAEHTIVACGKQTADPHCVGSGPLRPHQPIIIDIFPRSRKSGYYADMTRTVVKGRASPALKKMYLAVLRSQREAMGQIRAGVRGSKIHHTVCQTLETCGFKTNNKKGLPQGFIHSTGHGLGLEIHEPPRLGPGPDRLQKGHVITIEPGLYYPPIGGVRLEDVVYVTSKGCERLSHYPQILEIP